MLKLAPFLLLVFILSGCSSDTQRYRDEMVSKLSVGMIVEELELKLGNPTDKWETELYQVWYYEFRSESNVHFIKIYINKLKKSVSNWEITR